MFLIYANAHRERDNSDLWVLSIYGNTAHCTQRREEKRHKKKRAGQAAMMSAHGQLEPIRREEWKGGGARHRICEPSTTQNAALRALPELPEKVSF